MGVFWGSNNNGMLNFPSRQNRMVLFRLCCLPSDAPSPWTRHFPGYVYVYRRLTQRDCCRNADRDYARGWRKVITNWFFIVWIASDTVFDIFFRCIVQFGETKLHIWDHRSCFEIHADIRGTLRFKIIVLLSKKMWTIPSQWPRPCRCCRQRVFLTVFRGSYSVITLLYAMEGWTVDYRKQMFLDSDSGLAVLRVFMTKECTRLSSCFLWSVQFCFL
jgi:hypothetical protein